MSDQDDKLEKLIQQFQSTEPSSEQSLQWFLTIQQKRNSQFLLYRQCLSLAVGLALGILVSSFLLRTNQIEDQYTSTYTMTFVKNLAGN